MTNKNPIDMLEKKAEDHKLAIQRLKKADKYSGQDNKAWRAHYFKFLINNIELPDRFYYVFFKYCYPTLITWHRKERENLLRRIRRAK